LSDRETPVVLIVVAALILGALAFTVQSILSPFVLLAALLILLHPYRREPVARKILTLGVFLFMVWFTVSLLGLLAPFLVALFLAYLLNPLVAMAERRKIPRWAGALLSLLAILLVATGAIVFLLPPAVTQLKGAISSAASMPGDLLALLQSEDTLAFMQRFGIAPDQVRTFLAEQISPRLEGILTKVFEVLLGVVTSMSAIVLQLVNIIIIPFLVFYLLKDLPDLRRRMVDLFPAARQADVEETLDWVDGILGRYFRGAVLVALIQGIIAGVALALIGVDYALVLGLMTGVLNFIPYVGLLISLVVSSLVAILSGGAIGGKVISVVLLYLSQKLLEATVLGPKIVGSEVGLHPVALILCLLVFGYFLGFVGLLIAVPATALMMSGTGRWLDREQKRNSTDG
jgi:predicted PurR-regulated permease PerM